MITMEIDYKKRAKELFFSGFNCSQAVFCTFAEDYNIPEELALRLSASFGGGIGRMRETCGALCGICILAGLEAGQTQGDDQESKHINYALVQKFFQQFQQKNGGTRCAELLKLREEEIKAHDAQPTQRSIEYYQERPCLRMVDSAVEIFQEYKNGKSNSKKKI